MSFLKARQAVQTCALSSRWRYLWRSVPCLDIDFDEFKNTMPPSDDKFGSGGRRKKNVYISDDSSDSDDDIYHSDSDSGYSDYDRHNANDDGNNRIDWEFTKYKDWEDFEDFAVNLMRRCNIAQLDSFRLHIVGSRSPEFGKRQATGWLRRVMKYCTPDRASQHGGLSFGSWRLKRLHLCHVLIDNRFLKLISSVCRSLEDLELDDCSCEIQSVNSHSLKTLVLRNCGWRNLSEIISSTLKTLVIDGGSNTNDCVLVILAPTVAYLHLAVKADQFSGGVLMNEMPAVAKACIHLQGHRYSNYGSKLYGDQFKLLCNISNSTNLELSGVGSRVLGDGKEPRFQNFKNLKLLLDNCDLSDDFKILVFFLRCSPILEKVLRLCEFPKYSNIKKGTHELNKTSGLFGSIPARQRTSQASISISGAQNRMPGGAPCASRPSSELRGLDLLCENLKVEIIHKNGYGPHLRQLLLHVSVNLQKNNIKLTKVN